MGDMEVGVETQTGGTNYIFREPSANTSLSLEHKNQWYIRQTWEV